MWAWVENKGLKFISLISWQEKGVLSCFTTRKGGTSEAPFAGLNLGLHVGDDVSRVLANRRKMVEALGVRLGDLVCAQQVHGDKVAVVDEKLLGRGALAYDEALPGVDGLVTGRPGVFLTMFFADCVPIYMFDPRKRVVGLAHAGWRGTLSGIGNRVLGVMQRIYGCEAGDIEVFIGPSIGGNCYGVDKELGRRVQSAFAFSSEILYPKSDDRFLWDLQETNRLLLLKEGVKAEKIEVCRLCTHCRSDLFFSYRAVQGPTGRMAALIGLRS